MQLSCNIHIFLAIQWLQAVSLSVAVSFAACSLKAPGRPALAESCGRAPEAWYFGAVLEHLRVGVGIVLGLYYPANILRLQQVGTEWSHPLISQQKAPRT